jgi:hypothetical protein
MASHILNDENELVWAVGAPGSLKRTECLYPGLLKRLEEIDNDSDAIDEIRRSGIPFDPFDQTTEQLIHISCERRKENNSKKCLVKP